ncbi:putative inactive group IIC secretory phospholipase A2 isoform X6 [Sciurus carolinensis]|uniref:putative inactive group IIC secretory phospholipase A2 isoform X6 n=1 Tax=Sciurus carolinensis TaxID=30640 RepID=UPI001FB1E956|nr:putative inactive group IIC secretory phospholipase A2 isoform X6 [Sciurus carolinensis]XP_047408105.1 putative inactive group IIC secretory phospholipase A2 isoform X6 [Sciurus carolinensis]
MNCFVMALAERADWLVRHCLGEFDWQTKKVGPWVPGPPAVLGDEDDCSSSCLHLLPCCLTHDCCYKKLKESGCQPVLNSYQFHVINKTVVCGCSLGPGGSCLCGLKACECDRQSAFCFRRSLPTYERNFKLLSGRPPCGRQKLQC